MDTNRSMPGALALATLKASALATALAAALTSGAALADTVNARFPRQASDAENRFTRMFPDLPAFAPQTDAVRTAVRNLGARGGLIDALDDDDVTPPSGNAALPGPHNPDNPAMTAGFTFLGQFLDHDLTLDLRSRLLERAEPGRTLNFRTAAFDLDSVYGDGPDKQPELYDPASTDIKFRVDPNPGSVAVSRGGALRFDLPRDAGGEALIADSRNDENLMLSQLHLAMLRFHNAVTDHLRAQPRNAGLSSRELFQRARRLVQWHYQWIVLNEFLPTTIGADRVRQIRREGLRFFDAQVGERGGERGRGNADRKGPRIPIEFSVAAYRFGHSQVRPGYRANLGPTGGAAFAASIFDDTLDPNAVDPEDLRGGRRAARRFIDWQGFFDFGDGNARNNKMIDSRLSTPLLALPGATGPAPGLPNDGVQSLPSRNLIRHVNFGLPSGQAIAKRMRVAVLSPAQLAQLKPLGLAESTPLWFYILKEAEILEGGRRLGPVGARIVGEVFIGLLEADRDSFLSAEPRWRPTLPSSGGRGTFRMVDLLNFAGVVHPL